MAPTTAAGGTGSLARSSEGRSGAIAGLAFAVLFFVGQNVFILGAPGDYSSDTKIKSYYADAGNYHKIVAGKVLVMLSVVALLWFVGLLVARMRAAGAPDHLRAASLSSGIASAAFLGAEAVLVTAIASSLSFGDEFKAGRLDPQAVRLLDQIAYSLLILALLTAAALVFAASLAARRSGFLPRWLVIGSYVVAGLLIPTATVGPVGVALFALWTAAVSIVTLRAGTPGL